MPRSPLLVRKAVSFQKPYRLMWSLRAALSFHGLMTLSRDRKSTRLNSSHGYISYAVFCLKKKKNEYVPTADSLAKRHHTQRPPVHPFRHPEHHHHYLAHHRDPIASQAHSPATHGHHHPHH